MDCKLLNSDLKNVTTNTLLGLTRYNQEIACFDFGNVVVQRDYLENENVRIISGGAQCYGQFIGKGMLTCAVQGENWVSPASKIILRTLKELSYNHTKGCLVLVCSSGENLLNFGLAVEKALSDNLRIKILGISDDCRNVNLEQPFKQGLSGIILISKIAGALSEKGTPLQDIYKFCEKLRSNILSTGVNFRDMIPDAANKCFECTRIKTIFQNPYVESTAEEGVSKKDSVSVADIFKYTIEELIFVVEDEENEEDVECILIAENKINLTPGNHIVILMNNTGVLTKTEELLFVQHTVETLKTIPINVQRFYISNVLRFNKDLTVTVMKVETTDILQLLDEPCTAVGWRSVNQGLISTLTTGNVIKGCLVRKERSTPPIKGPRLTDPQANTLLFAAQFACEALISCERQLNTVDSERGKGNIGTRLRQMADILLRRFKQNKVTMNYPATFFETISRVLESKIGGCSGCIYGFMFEAIACSFAEYDETTEVTPHMWLTAFNKAAKALEKYGNVKYGDGTMYDPIKAGLMAVREELDKQHHFVDAFGRGVSVAEQIAQLTKRSYLYPDSGSHAVGIWMRAAYEGIKLKCPILDNQVSSH